MTTVPNVCAPPPPLEHAMGFGAPPIGTWTQLAEDVARKPRARGSASPPGTTKVPSSFLRHRPRGRDPEENDSYNPADDRQDEPADEEQHERPDLDRPRAALVSASRSSSGLRRDLASLGRDVGGIAHPVEQVADVGLAFRFEPGTRLGDVLGDFLDELAPARRWEVRQLALEMIEVVLDQLVSRSAHFDSVLSTK
jgi:hypothetical protein